MGTTQHQHLQQQEAKKLEHKKLVEDMKFLTSQNELLQTEISNLKKSREQLFIRVGHDGDFHSITHPRFPSEKLESSLMDQVNHCMKFVTTVQNELDACRKGVK